MTIVSKLRSAATRAVELPDLTRELRELGELTSDQRIMVRIRKVRAAEVAAAIGTVPLLFSLSRERQEGESAAEFAQRMQDKFLDDSRLQQAASQQQLASQAAVVALGVTAVGVATLDGEPEWEPLTLDVHGGEPNAGLLGGSLATVHDAILAFGTVDLPRMGGAAGTETFPGQPASAAGEQSSGVLRGDSEPVPESPAG